MYTCRQRHAGISSTVKQNGVMSGQHADAAWFSHVQLMEDASAVMTQLPPERGLGALARIAAGDALPAFQVQVGSAPRPLDCDLGIWCLLQPMTVSAHAGTSLARFLIRAC